MWCTISYSDEGLKNIYYFDLVVEKVKDNKCGVTNENIEKCFKMHKDSKRIFLNNKGK